MVLDSGSTGFKPSSRLQAYHAVTHPSSLGLRSHPIFLPVSPGSPVCDFSLHLSPVEPHSRLLRQRSAWCLLLIVLNTGPTLHLQPPWTLASYQLPCRLLWSWQTRCHSWPVFQVTDSAHQNLVDFASEIALETFSTFLHFFFFFLTICGQWSVVAKRVVSAIRPLRASFFTCTMGVIIVPVS